MDETGVDTHIMQCILRLRIAQAPGLCGALRMRPYLIRALRRRTRSAVPQLRLLSVPSSRDDEVSNWNAANYLTGLRLAMAPAIGALILYDHNALALGALCICGVTDALDGHIARTRNCRTQLGATLDPLADKALVASSVAALCIQGALPVPLVAIVVARDVVLVCAASVLPRSKWIQPTLLSKSNTALQISLCVAAVASSGDLSIVPQYVVNGLAIATATTTALSGAQYVARFVQAHRA